MISDERFVLAIDLGTSGPKIALVNREGDVESSVIESTGLTLLPGGGAEQDPEDWWRAVVEGTRSLLSRSAVVPDRIEAVVATAQWSGTVPVNRNGKHIANALVWMDSRGAPYVQQRTGGFPTIEGYNIFRLWRWIRRTGGIPTHSGKDSVAHILFLKHEKPEIYNEAYKFLEPKDYINLRLTGLFASSVEAMTLHWVTDNRRPLKIDYDHRLIQMLGLDREKLPDLKLAVDVLGPLTSATARELGLLPGIPVVMGTPDLHSAAIGSGAVRDYEAHLYIGTSSWLTCHVPFKKTDIFHNLASLPAAIPGRYFVANEQETAGECVKFLRDRILFSEEDAFATPVPADFFETLEQTVQQVPAGSGGVLFLPWLYGERTPVEDHNIRGGFLNLNTNRAHMARAVLEGVALNTRWLLKYVEAFIGRRLPAINAIGGGATSGTWCQIFADVLDRPICQVERPIEANARGAGLLAWLALGKTTVPRIAESVKIAQRFEPNPGNKTLYNAHFSAFLEAYRASGKVIRRLNPRD